ncbi:hypothetical protein KIW84_044828, partial [Lathyrus oleraceus]
AHFSPSLFPCIGHNTFVSQQTQLNSPLKAKPSRKTYTEFVVGRLKQARLESNRCVMAGYIIRRALSCRNLFRLPTCALHVCENSPVKLCISDASTRVVTLPTV